MFPSPGPNEDPLEVPPSAIEKDQPAMLDERESFRTYEEGMEGVSTLLKTSAYMSVCSMHVPLTVAVLFMNLGAVIIPDENVCTNTFAQRRQFLPNYLNQPDVNNRRVHVNDIYDPELSGKPNRKANEFGSIETAWGVAESHSMSASKAVVYFYEVHALDKEDDCPHAKLRPCLESIPSDTTLAGSPYATRLTIESAVALCVIFTGHHPSKLFDDFPKESIPEEKKDQLAHRLVCSVIQYIRVRFNSLRERKDWESLHCVLLEALCPVKDLEWKKMPGAGGEDDPEHLDWPEEDRKKKKSLFGKMPAENIWGETDVWLRKRVWLLMNTVTPIRISFLDGQRRATGAMYAMMHRLPERSLEQLANSLDPLCPNQDLLVSHSFPDFNVLSDWVTMDSVRPNVVTKKTRHDELPEVELRLLKRHSELVQQQSTSARERTFRDAFVGLLSKIEKDHELRKSFTVIGEIKMRRTSANKKIFQKPNDWPKEDHEKNDKVYRPFWDYVIGELFSDTARSVDHMVKTALNKMTDEVWATNELLKRSQFVDANRKSYESDSNSSGTISTSKSNTKVRTDLNTIAMLCAGFVSDVPTLNKLIDLTVMESGSLVPLLCEKYQDALKNKDGLVPGKPEEGGCLHGVSHSCEDWLKKMAVVVPLIGNHYCKYVAWKCR
jgi:hypothetical protein